MPKFNDKFGQNIRKFESAFDDSPSSEKINYTLAILSPRTFDSGSAISFKNHYYQATDASNKLICFAKGTKCLVIQALDGQLLVNVDEEVYALTEIPKNAKVSPDLDFEAKKKKPRKKYIHRCPILGSETRLLNNNAKRTSITNLHKNSGENSPLII